MRAWIQSSVLAVALALAAAGPAAAQTPNAGAVPDRNATTYNGREHEPSPADVPEGSPGEQRRQIDEVERLARELQKQVPQDSAAPAPQPGQ
jgi:hypothetical protein